MSVLAISQDPGERRWMAAAQPRMVQSLHRDGSPLADIRSRADDMQKPGRLAKRREVDITASTKVSLAASTVLAPPSQLKGDQAC